MPDLVYWDVGIVINIIMTTIRGLSKHGQRNYYFIERKVEKELEIINDSKWCWEIYIKWGKNLSNILSQKSHSLWQKWKTSVAWFCYVFQKQKRCFYQHKLVKKYLAVILFHWECLKDVNRNQNRLDNTIKDARWCILLLSPNAFLYTLLWVRSVNWN